jgi:methylmalonyl-CoA mutase N-terminal domain/subunit
MSIKHESEPRFSRSGVPLKDYYGPEDVKNIPLADRPGDFPFTRGRRAHAVPIGGWIQRELSGEGDPKRSNEQFHFLISHGQTGLDVIGDSPTQACMDPDHPLSAKAIGTQGLSVCIKQDYLDLFKDIPLDKVSMSSSVPHIFFMAGLYLSGRHYGFDTTQLRGSTLLPPFFCEPNAYSVNMPVRCRVRMCADVMEFGAKEMPRFHSFIEDTYFFAEAGLTGVEEMALGFIEIRHLVREVLKRGVDIDSFAPRIAILVDCSMDFFEEIAKIRATRQLFAKMMRDEFGAKDPRSLATVITSHTSGLTLTAQQLANNIVRGTTQALALVLAGAQAIEISTFDEALRTPSEEAHMVGLRTQQIIERETGVSKVVDPLGGSYYVEALTAEMAKRIWDLVLEIEARGDAIELHENGWFRSFFEEKMQNHVRQLENGEVTVVGLNSFKLPPEKDTLLRDVSEGKIRPFTERADHIRAFKTERNQEDAKSALRSVREAAKEDRNLVPFVIDAMERNATMGEISGVIRQAYGMPYDVYGAVEAII